MRLTEAQREFCRLVGRAATANPFTETRRGLDRQIAGWPGPPRPRAEVADAVAAVAAQVAQLEHDGAARLRDLDATDRDLAQELFLFEEYHRAGDALDRLTLDQARHGEEPCPVTFADTVLSGLRRRGFATAQALRYFAVFYQLRRAFHLIADRLPGCSRCMQALRERLWQNVFTLDLRRYEQQVWNRMEDFSVLLLGETGTGKGAAAAAIGCAGFIPFAPQTGRFAESFVRNFVPINLSQFPAALIESELFGHRRGAFTGAIADYAGAFSRCRQYGAVFLDEIGDVPVPVQLKLLRVLQERTFTPVGGGSPQRFSGRVIAATNQPLTQLRRGGTFRDDFYYRLCSDVILVPTLRERLADAPEELDLLVGHVVARLLGRRADALAGEVLASLRANLPKAYAWPGNVRELEQAVRRVLVHGRYDGDTGAPIAQGRQREDALAEVIRAGTATASELLAGYCALLHERHGTYEAVASRTGLDRRTAAKYVRAARDSG